MFLTGGQWKGHAQPRKGVRASVQRVISLTTYFYKVLSEGGDNDGRKYRYAVSDYFGISHCLLYRSFLASPSLSSGLKSFLAYD